MSAPFLRHHHRGAAREAAAAGSIEGPASRAHRAGTRPFAGHARAQRPRIARVARTGPRLMLLDRLSRPTPSEFAAGRSRWCADSRTGNNARDRRAHLKGGEGSDHDSAERVLVFQPGHVIAHGKPRESSANELVIDAYLDAAPAAKRTAVTEWRRLASECALRPSSSFDVSPSGRKGSIVALLRLQRLPARHDAQPIAGRVHRAADRSTGCGRSRYEPS